MKKAIFFVLMTFGAMGLSGCKQGESASQGPVERIKVVMKKYSIEPPVIAVKSGARTELEVSTADVQHGFGVPQLGINESIQPGRPAVIAIKSPAKGEYKVVCSILCGPHHEDMTAKIVAQ
ncbi:MAG TPA: cupredoxin domain-containing protein [Candidatus Angelobacter sp.]|nr:cupredoxin domain-containing protein [Candidatus Angelobacter sp.]